MARRQTLQTETRGWLQRNRWLFWRRVSQIAILGLFLVPALPAAIVTPSLPDAIKDQLARTWAWIVQQWPELVGMRVVKGNLSSSLTLDWIPLTDPHLLLQVLLTGQIPEATAFIGALIVVLVYALIGGRVFCSWVCPVNWITDLAAWLRRKLDLKASVQLSRSARYWVLGLTLLLAAGTGTLAWELVNPVSTSHRGLIFGMGLGWLVLLAVFLFDLLVAKHGWCGRLCPVGAFYSLLGYKSLVRVGAVRRDACDDCMDCFLVCPEPQVIRPALKGASKGIGPVIEDINCTNCGRCIDVCDRKVFEFGGRNAVATGTDGIEVRADISKRAGRGSPRLASSNGLVSK